jgi:hypothetical protein
MSDETVVPPELSSRSSWMTPAPETESRLPVGSSASNSGGSPWTGRRAAGTPVANDTGFDVMVS